MYDLDALAQSMGAKPTDSLSRDPRASKSLLPTVMGKRGYPAKLRRAADNLYEMLQQDEYLQQSVGKPVMIRDKPRGKLPRLRRRPTKEQVTALETLLHSLAHIASAPVIMREGKRIRQDYVAIPMDNNAFKAGADYDFLSRTAFQSLVLALTQFNGWLEFVPAHYNAETGERRRSRVRPTPPFLDWLVMKQLVFPGHPAGPGKAKAIDDAELLQVSHKKTVKTKTGKNKTVRAETNTMLDRPLQGEELILPALNKALMKQKLHCHLQGYADYENLFNFRRGWARNALTGNKCVYRVFSEEDGRAGRLYGHWVQPLSKELRGQLTINNKPTVELDYGNMQLVLLYARMGMPVPEGEDLYSIPGTSYRRDDMKQVLARTVGNRTRSEAIRSLKHMLHEQGRQSEQAEEWYGAFWDYHQGISPHQGKTEAAWAVLQNLDSTLALRVLGRLLEEGVTAIPVHDSFLVEERHADITEAAMIEEFSHLFPGMAVTVKRT